MTDDEARRIIMKIVELRVSESYRAAELLRRATKGGAGTMAAAKEDTKEHAAVRLLIGTWERIAMFVEDFTETQRRRLFTCNPVVIAWEALWPGIDVLRKSGNVGPRFAAEFEWLATQYRRWTETTDGQEYRTYAQQAVCALFF